MTGDELRQIRLANKIKQEDIALRFGYNSRRSIYDLEREDKIPVRFVKIFSKIVGIDLLDDKIFQKELSEVPDKFKIPQKRPQTNMRSGFIRHYPASLDPKNQKQENPMILSE